LVFFGQYPLIAVLIVIVETRGPGLEKGEVLA
jgi:hypothetical protein